MNKTNQITEAKLREILGELFVKIKGSIVNRQKKNLDCTNENVLKAAKLFGDEPKHQAKIDALVNLSQSDPTHVVLAHLFMNVTSAAKNLPAKKPLGQVSIENKDHLIENKAIIKSYEKNNALIENTDINVKITIRSSVITDYLSKFMKDITSPQLCKAFKAAIEFFKIKVKEEVYSPDNFLNLIELVVDDGNKNDQQVLIETKFIYSLLPLDMSIEFNPPPRQILAMRIIKVSNVTFDIVKENERKIEEKEVFEQKRLASKFVNFICYFADIPYIQVTREEIAAAISKAKNKFFGIDLLGDQIGSLLERFSSVFYSLPKGIMFYGPPGTGKSAIISFILECLPFEYLCPPLAAGDFNKGIVGDSERMINQLARRAKAVPWQLCCLMVDEIDALAPDRMSKSTSAHTINTLSVLLSVLDGGKITPNLKIFATTNKFEQMDEAFCRRLDLKQFIGKPDFEARGIWIKEMIKKITYLEKQNYITSLMNPTRCELIKEMTLNFSCDALKKLFSKLFDDLVYKMSEKLEDKAINKMIINHVIEVCITERILFGPCELPKILEESKLTLEDPKYGEMHSFYAMTQNLAADHMFTKRIFIDVSENPAFQFQVETISGKLNSSQINVLGIPYESPAEGFLNLKEAFPGYEFPTLNDFPSLEAAAKALKIEIEKLSSQHEHRQLPCYGIKDGIKSLVKDVYTILIKFACSNHLATVSLVDDHFLIRKESSDDAVAELQVAYAYEEAKKHRSGMVIYNLDSIAGQTKEYSGLKTEFSKSDTEMDASDGIGGPSLHYTKLRPKALQQALSIFADAKDTSGFDNVWVVAISSHPYLTKQFKERVDWPETRPELEAKRIAMQKKRRFMCKNCHCSYCETENVFNICGKHKYNELYLVCDLEKLKKDCEHLKQVLSPDMIVSKIIRYSYTTAIGKIEANQIPPSQFRWCCCDKGIFEKGEIPCQHESE